MKNLPQRVRAKRRSPSSYARKKKQPFVYSAELRNWRQAIIDNKKPAADAHHAMWVKKFWHTVPEQLAA